MILRFLGWIRDKINHLQMEVYGWMEKDKQLHFFVGMMILSLSHKMASFTLSVSMLVVTIAAFSKELFDKYIKHLFGFKKGEFDKEDIAYTMLGGAVIITIVGIIDLFRLLF